MDADRVVLVARDVTERRRGAEALRASEQRFRSLVEHSTDVIALLDTDGTIRYSSASTHLVLGYSGTENLGRDAFELIHPDDRLRALERSEEHTSELQSRLHLVCRLLLEKKK